MQLVAPQSSLGRGRSRIWNPAILCTQTSSGLFLPAVWHNTLTKQWFFVVHEHKCGNRSKNTKHIGIDAYGHNIAQLSDFQRLRLWTHVQSDYGPHLFVSNQAEAMKWLWLLKKKEKWEREKMVVGSGGWGECVGDKESRLRWFFWWHLLNDTLLILIGSPIVLRLLLPSVLCCLFLNCTGQIGWWGLASHWTKPKTVGVVIQPSVTLDRTT